MFYALANVPTKWNIYFNYVKKLLTSGYLIVKLKNNNYKTTKSKTENSEKRQKETLVKPVHLLQLSARFNNRSVCFFFPFKSFQVHLRNIMIVLAICDSNE